MYKEKHFDSEYNYKVSKRVAKFLNEECIKQENIVAINFWFDNSTDESCASVIYKSEN